MINKLKALRSPGGSRTVVDPKEVSLESANAGAAGPAALIDLRIERPSFLVAVGRDVLPMDWAVEDSARFAEGETAPFISEIDAARPGLIGHSGTAQRVISTRRLDGSLRPLGELSLPLRRRIIAQAQYLADQQGDTEGWWASPLPVVRSPIVVLPLSEEGRPTVFTPPTFVAPSVFWARHSTMSAAALAALLTAGPFRVERRSSRFKEPAIPELPEWLSAEEDTALATAYLANDMPAVETLANQLNFRWFGRRSLFPQEDTVENNGVHRGSALF